jgi:hypothetical protein
MTLAVVTLATACESNGAPSDQATVVATSPTHSSGESAVLPKLTTTFVSPWYGYSVGYPSNWTTTDGKGPWPSGDVLRHGDPRLDVIEGSTAAAGEARFVGASQPVPAGTTLQRFAGQENPFSCAAGDRLPRRLTVDGAKAFVTLDGCPSEADLGGLIWDVVVISSGRAYDFTIDGAIGASDAALLLASIRLYPASARTH